MGTGDLRATRRGLLHGRRWCVGRLAICEENNKRPPASPRDVQILSPPVPVKRDVADRVGNAVAQRDVRSPESVRIAASEIRPDRLIIGGRSGLHQLAGIPKESGGEGCLGNQLQVRTMILPKFRSSSIYRWALPMSSK
jgi:hypothetical protein